jgi:hypothetical protein
MATRNYEILRTAKTQQECQRTMAYPLGYVNDQWQEHYSLENILRPIVLEKDSAAAGDFPKNIREFFWVRCGENDGDSWLAAGQLTNDNYFFYSGGCDYTGFDCQGGMSLWVSKSWKNIVDHAMDGRDYEAYLRLDEPKPEDEYGQDSEAEGEEEKETDGEEEVETEAEGEEKKADIVDEVGPAYTGIICKRHLERGVRRAATFICEDGTFCVTCFEEVCDEWKRNYVPKYPLCSHCHQEEGGCPNEFTDEGERLCADCYWDFDAEAKRKRRAHPSWRYSRVYSACLVLLNQTEEQARKRAYDEVEKMPGGPEWLDSNVSCP